MSGSTQLDTCFLFQFIISIIQYNTTVYTMHRWSQTTTTWARRPTLIAGIRSPRAYIPVHTLDRKLIVSGKSFRWCYCVSTHWLLLSHIISNVFYFISQSNILRQWPLTNILILSTAHVVSKYVCLHYIYTLAHICVFGSCHIFDTHCQPKKKNRKKNCLYYQLFLI